MQVSFSGNMVPDTGYGFIFAWMRGTGHSAGISGIRFVFFMYFRNRCKNTDGDRTGMIENNRIQSAEMAGEQKRTQDDALYEMAGLVAHEVRTSLGGIQGYVHLLAESIPEEDPKRAMVNHIIHSARHLNDTISALVLFSSPVRAQFRTISFCEFMKDVLSRFERDNALIKDAVELKIPDWSLWKECHVFIDPVLMEQAFLAILNNAAQALSGGGVIEVGIRLSEDMPHSLHPCILVTIRDSGPGIPNSIHPKIIEPFFTTRHKGMGLGLAIAKKFITFHKGNLYINSEEGTGTTVTISIPMKEGERRYGQRPRPDCGRRSDSPQVCE